MNVPNVLKEDQQIKVTLELLKNCFEKNKTKNVFGSYVILLCCL